MIALINRWKSVCYIIAYDISLMFYILFLQDYLGQYETNLGEIVSSGSSTKPLKPYNGTGDCGSIISKY